MIRIQSFTRLQFLFSKNCFLDFFEQYQGNLLRIEIQMGIANLINKYILYTFILY